MLVIRRSYPYEEVEPKARRRTVLMRGSLKPVVDRLVKGAVVAALVAVLAGCAVVKPVPESADQKQIYALAMSCESHFPLTQDCSNLTGPEQLIVIDEVRVKVAGSAAGDIVLVESGNKAGEFAVDTVTGFFNPLFLVAPQNMVASQGANGAYSAVTEVLDQNGISITRVHAVRGGVGLDVYGYVLELGGDGYSVLKNYALVEQSPVETNGGEREP